MSRICRISCGKPVNAWINERRRYFMPPEVNVSSLNPDRRRIVRDLLIIDDLVGYSKSGAGYVDGYATSFLLGQTSTGISLSPEAKGMLTDRTRPKTANQVSARQESRLTIQNKERYRQYQGRLNRPESHADLEAVLREIDNDRSISDARQKDYMKDCLIIDDLNGFRQDKTHYAQGYVYQALLGNLTGVSTETKLLINGSVDVVTGNVIVSPLGIANVKAQLLRELGTSREYIKLRDTLTTPYSNQDLLGALCQLDPREPFCLQILTIGPRVRPGEQNKTIRLTGLNLPDAAQVDISSPNPGLPPITVEPGSYVRIDDRQATIKVSVPDNFPANALPVSYSLTVASQNCLYRSTVTNAISIVGAAGDPTEPGVPCESPRVCAIPYPPLKLFVAPETLMANNESQTLNIVGDGADSIKMIRLIVPATGTDVVVPITVSQEMFSDGGRRLSIRIALDPIKLAALFPDRAKGPFQLKLIVTDGAGQIVTVSNDLTIIVIQDRVIVERVPYQLPPLVHNVIRPDLSIGVSIQENSSSVPLVLGLNPGLIGKTAPIKSQYFELAAKGDCSFFSGEVVDGCRAQGYINIAYWGFKLESAGQAKYATSGSVYNLPYY